MSKEWVTKADFWAECQTCGWSSRAQNALGTGAQHAETCAMCKKEIERYDPDHGYDYRRDIRWCAEYRRMHAELWHLIGIARS